MQLNSYTSRFVDIILAFIQVVSLMSLKIEQGRLAITFISRTKEFRQSVHFQSVTRQENSNSSNGKINANKDLG